jgi:hypothetical protein
MILPRIENGNSQDQHSINIRNELIVRFLTAFSINYEKQWYLGMTRRKTLDILIKSVEQANQKSSFQLHGKLILQHFRFTNQWTDRLFFEHIFQTIELTLGKL